MRYSLVGCDEAPLLKGRRDYLQYRDYGLEAASNGWIRAQLIGGRTRTSPPTGWHYHVCDAQIVYYLQGTSDLEFEDGQRFRAKAGDMLFIPGGVRHNESNASLDLECIEIAIPADLGTVTVEPPDIASTSKR
jgi:uncharacterized RmlC-like cupin family protein